MQPQLYSAEGPSARYTTAGSASNSWGCTRCVIMHGVHTVSAQHGPTQSQQTKAAKKKTVL